MPSVPEPEVGGGIGAGLANGLPWSQGRLVPWEHAVQPSQAQGASATPAAIIQGTTSEFLSPPFLLRAQILRLLPQMATEGRDRALSPPVASLCLIFILSVTQLSLILGSVLRNQ